MCHLRLIVMRITMWIIKIHLMWIVMSTMVWVIHRSWVVTRIVGVISIHLMGISMGIIRIHLMGISVRIFCPWIAMAHVVWIMSSFMRIAT